MEQRARLPHRAALYCLPRPGWWRPNNDRIGDRLRTGTQSAPTGDTHDTGLAVESTASGFISQQFVTTFGWEAIFVFGGVLPMILIPLLILFLPESRALRTEPTPARRASVLRLFRDGLAPQTIVLWIVDFCNILCGFLILVWLPALLHGEGLSPADAIFASTMYGLGRRSAVS